MEEWVKLFKKLGYSDQEIENLYDKVDLVPDQTPAGKVIARVKYLKVSFNQLRPDEKKLALAAIASVVGPISLGLLYRAGLYLAKQNQHV